MRPGIRTGKAADMTMRLGHFREFKQGDVVLLSCDPKDVATLRANLAAAMAKKLPLAIHELATVPERQPARLFVWPASLAIRRGGDEFIWKMSDQEPADVDAKLQPLSSTRASHPYFDLDRPGVQLMVSVGEYGEDWWTGKVSDR
jgi:hypothetical protein